MKTLLTLCGVTGIIAIVFAVFAISMAYEPPSGQERPKVTDWMQAWGSIGAFIVGTGAAIFTALLLLHEFREAARARADAQEARAEAAQERAEAAADRARIEAERIDAMKAPARAVIHGDRVGFSGHPSLGLISRISIQVDNFGSTPIRMVEVSIFSRNDEEKVDLEPIRLIGPQDSVRVSQKFSPERTLPGIANENVSRIELYFVDVNGRPWLRVNNGEPQPTPRRPERT